MEVNNIEVIDAEIIKTKKTFWLWRVISSRFKKESNEDWVLERRDTCKTCEFNSLNSKEKRTVKSRIFKFLSDFLTFITFSKNENLGVCTICDCPLYYKQLTEEEECHAEPSKWKSIYIPNKK